MTQEESPMKIKALAPWFGAKRNLAPRIVEVLGPHRSYFEPFCGSMAVLFAKPEASHENVNDLHSDLINLALVIQDHKLGPLLYRRLRRTWLTEQAFLRERDVLLKQPEAPEAVDVERAYSFFVVGWFGRNGILGTQSYNFGFCARWTPNGGHGGKRFASAVDSIPAWRRRMRRVTILKRDGFEFLESIEDCRGSVAYVDPPYLVKGAKYKHDFAPEDHERLAVLLHRFKKARIVLSYYDHPKLSELYPDWHQDKIEVSKALSHQGRRGENDVRAVEVLLCNQPIEALKGQGGLWNE